MFAVNGKELRRKRMSLGLNQIQLAARLEINQNTISRYETGALPIPKLVELAVETVERQVNLEEQTESPEVKNDGQAK